MKNFIQVIAIAVVSFSNVVSASGLIKKVDFIDDLKIKQVKMVSYADTNLFNSEIEGLQSYSKTVLDIVNSDSKITENENNFLSNSFVNYANSDLLSIELTVEKAANSIDVQIENDLKITENEVQKTNFVSYANENLINLEIGTLKNTNLSTNEKIIINLKIIESKNTIRKATNKKVVIKKTIKY